MADSVTAQDKGTGFTPHDEGQFAAVCADVVDLGQRLEQFAGKLPRLAPKCALVFVTNSPGETKDVSAEVTVTMGEKATLRGLLESWRGKGYTPEQVAAGIPLDKLVGHPALLSIEHKRSGKGNVYAKIRAISPLPKEMLTTAPAVTGYVRGEWWAGRKKAYAEEAAKFLQTVAKNDELVQPVEDDDDALPF